MKLSILIVNWNTCELIRLCLESIQINPPLCEYEVWVVDNASVDDSLSMLQREFVWVHLVQNDQNAGFARANNQAIRLSSGEFILLLNSDTIVQKDALTNLVGFMQEHPQVGLVGANLINPDGSMQMCSGNQPTLFSESVTCFGLERRWPLRAWFERFNGPHQGSEKEYQLTGWVLGAALLVRRSDLERVGLLDESYFMYSEEVDWARRFLVHGLQVVKLENATITHLGQASSQKTPNRMIPQLYKSKIYFFSKHYGMLTSNIFRGVLAIAALLRILLYRIGSLYKASNKTKVNTWQQVLGIVLRG